MSPYLFFFFFFFFEYFFFFYVFVKNAKIENKTFFSLKHSGRGR